MVEIPVSRREFIGAAALAGGAAKLSGVAAAQGPTRAAATPAGDVGWIDGPPPAAHDGQVWGMAWPRGAERRTARFALAAADGSAVPVQSWPTASWPDGSLKWSAHAIPAGAGRSAALTLRRGRPTPPPVALSVRETADAVEIRSGALVWRIARTGASVIASATRDGRETLRDVRLVALAQAGPDEEGDAAPARTRYESAVTAATVEQDGPIRAVVKLEGRHRGSGRDWLPFVLRLSFHAGSDAVRIVHSFIFDGDETRDFLRGLGLSGTVPMNDLPHDRHVRFAASDDGVWGEAVRPLTGLRRDPGEAFRSAQVAGRKTPDVGGMAPAVREALDLIPAWGDFTLAQPNADGFTIAKRTKPGHGWIASAGGGRARGLGYVGGAGGGVAFAMKDFWQRPPTRLDVRDAHLPAARFTVWLWSPDAPAMDLRFYHDGLGMEDHAAENRGLDITYEDYEKGWGRPYGIARTNELTLWALPATPGHARLAEMAAGVATPPRLMARPARLHAAGVLGDWSLPDRSTPVKTAIEDQNDWLIRFYRDQVEARRWYGFWSHGDVMHSYDPDRHQWRYDIGGYAWANSELSPDLWLWYSYLRSGDAATFRLAEAMTRHTGEVDVCHIGPYRGLGTRHGVQHWADSSKQPRVSNAAYRRIYYYLTADERVGDLMRDLVDSDRTLLTVDIGRKVGARAPGSAPPGGNRSVTGQAVLPKGQAQVSFGTTWSALAAAWLTEWERTGDRRWRDRIVAGMESIAALPKQWFAGGAPFDVASGRFSGPGDDVSMSHLNAVFGAVETHAELFTLIDVPAYKAAWLDYCRYYNAPDAEFTAKTGARSRGRNLREGHSRLSAYAAADAKDRALAMRAWTEFFGGQAGLGLGVAKQAQRIATPAVPAPVEEAKRVSTNGASQWGLAAIQNLALIGDTADAAWAATPQEERTGQSGVG